MGLAILNPQGATNAIDRSVGAMQTPWRDVTISIIQDEVGRFVYTGNWQYLRHYIDRTPMRTLDPRLPSSQLRNLERWYFIFYDKLQKLEISVSVNWDRYEQLWGSIKESSGQQKW
jgi:hypothetical protein